MVKKLDHRERMQALIEHQAIDQIPVAFWRHFPVDDQQPGQLAAATIQFQDAFDFDFIKVSPASSFCLKDWGVRDKWKGNAEGTREYQGGIITHPEEWNTLRKLDPAKGTLGGQLECLRLLKKHFSANVPIIQTIFSPLAQAKHLVENGTLLAHLRQNPQELQAGLEVITQTTLDFMSACRETGIDGFYYAIQFGSYDLLSKSEFDTFQAAYDQKLFPQFHEMWLNVLHIHGKAIMAAEIAAVEYPLQIFNWHDRETAPDLKEGQHLFKRVVSGGLGRLEPMLLGNAQQVKEKIDDAVQQTGGRDFVLGTGCVLMQATPYGNIRAALDHARSIPI